MNAREGFYIKKDVFSIPVVNTKEELEDATLYVKIEPEMKPLLITEFSFNEASSTMDEICIKEEPIQDDLVSEFYYKVLYQFLACMRFKTKCCIFT